MFLSAEETQGLAIEVYDANGVYHGAVKWCDTETGTICSIYGLCPGVERQYEAPAPLKLINKETGLEISDPLGLATAAAFSSARKRDLRKWKSLEERISAGFTGISMGLALQRLEIELHRFSGHWADA